MNKKVKIFAAFVVIFSMIMCFAGCGNDKISNNPSSNSIKKRINIEDIAWNIDEGIVDGDRYDLLSYTNNTEYTITDFKITFKEKSGITEEEKSSFCADIQSIFEASDEDTEEVRNRPISMHAEATEFLIQVNLSQI